MIKHVTAAAQNLLTQLRTADVDPVQFFLDRKFFLDWPEPVPFQRFPVVVFDGLEGTAIPPLKKELDPEAARSHARYFTSINREPHQPILPHHIVGLPILEFASNDWRVVSKGTIDGAATA